MRYSILIALREFVENAKTKGFWIGILMFPLLIGVAVGVTAFLGASNPARHFVLVDQSGELGAPIERAIDRAHGSAVLDALNRYVQQNARSEGRPRTDLNAIPAPGADDADPRAVDRFIEAGGAQAYLERVQPSLREDAPEFVEPPRRFVEIGLPAGIRPDAPIEQIAQALRPYLTGDLRVETEDGHRVRPFAAILIGPAALDAVVRPGRAPAESEAAVQYWSANLTDTALAGLIRNALNDEVRAREYAARGVDPATVRNVEQTRLPVSALDPGKAEGEETVSIADRIVRNAPVAFVYLLWISIFMVMQMLLNNTIEEKSNRIIEVLLSSVTPGELMLGKLIGIAAIGLTMVGTWLATAFLGLQLYQGAGADVIGQVLDVVAGSGLLWMFLICFLLGYVIYAGMFLSAGSLCNDLKEAQNLQAPMMMIMLVPLLTMVFINMDPHGTLATVMTWIPIYTPFVMMNRAAADPPLLELVGATALMIATAALVLWMAGRVFRIGILRTGQRPKLIEVLRWIRAGGNS